MARRVLCLAIVLLLVTATSRAQRGISAALPPAPVADVSGVVFTTGPNRQPVRDALVMMAGVDVGVIRTTSTDASGKFHFASVPPGRFLVTAGKPGYLSVVHGARRDGRPGTPISLTARDRRTDVDLTLVRGATISGVVSDDAGRPVSGVRVRALQRRMTGGEVQLFGEVGSPTIVNTDEHGAYRIFDLPPGEYVVVSQPRGIAGPEVRALTAADVETALQAPAGSIAPLAPPPPGGGSSIAYAGVYYPSTTRAADATTVVLTAGEDRAHVDLSTKLVRLARVDGGITGGDARTIANLQVTLRPRGFDAAGAILNTMNVRPAPDGHFAFANVPPGEYSVLARTISAPPQGPNQQPPQRDGTQPARAPMFWALGDVSVNGENLFDVTFPLKPALTISGRVVFDGLTQPPEELSNVRVGVRATASTGTQGLPEPATIAKDGTFRIIGLVPGKYWLYPLVPATDQVTQIPDWVGESAMVDGRDALDVPLELSAGGLSGITMTLTGELQEITGIVKNASGIPQRGRTVVVFSVDKQFWFPQSRRIAMRQTDSAGAFVFGIAAGLPPGDYYLATIAEAVLDNERFEPEFLGSMLKDAKRVTLRKGDSVHVELK